MTGAVGDILYVVLSLVSGRIKNGISWLTGYLIWSFVDYFCVVYEIKQWVVFMTTLLYFSFLNGFFLHILSAESDRTKRVFFLIFINER